MKRKIFLEIESCGECPFCKEKRIYTADSWEHYYEFRCNITHNVIAEFENEPPVPDNCPILIK